MAKYDFDTITAAQALAWSFADSITSSHGTASQTTVLYDASNRVTVIIDNVQVTFGPVFHQASDINVSLIGYPDESTLYVGNAAANTVRLAPPPALPSGAVYGGGGGDRFEGGGNWLVQGNQGDDDIYLTGGANTVYGGQDNDRVVFANVFAAQIGNFGQGNRGDDSIVGSFKADTLLGGQGNDTLIGGDGGDFVNGNLGNDLVAGDGQLLGEGGNDTLASTFAGKATLLGGDGDDLIAVGGFNFSAPYVFSPSQNAGAAGGFASGDAGNDTIQASGGADTLMGGQGDDSLDGGNGASADILDGGDGTDTLSARSGSMILRGGDGMDRLAGGSGADTLDGGAGGDRMLGGAGADLFIVRDSFGLFLSSGIDQINDWAVEDRILIRTSAPTYTELTAADFETAVSTAEGLLAAGTFEVVAIRVGPDVSLFIDGSGVNTLFSVVSLVGRSLNDISADNFL